MELVCPAGNLPALRAAVDNGADSIYVGFRNATNARHFAGLNFSNDDLRTGIAYAHHRGRKVLLALNTYPQPSNWPEWTAAVDQAAVLGVDALIAADLGVLDYAANEHPTLRLHLSVQASATSAEAIRFHTETFGIRRAVLPRVLSLAQIRTITRDSPVEIEVFGFGSLCVMAEGRCYLSSYVTGRSPNTYGACSPASHVSWENRGPWLETRLGGVLIDRFASHEHAGYPTLCKGRFEVHGETGYVLEEPTSLNTLDLLPQLRAAGVAAIKIEGRQRSPQYVATVTRVWRAALDAVAEERDSFQVRGEWQQALQELSEGTQTTLGAYHRSWR